MRVLKFGGTALRDGPAVRHAVRIVREFGGERPVVVVSAHFGVTSLLARAVEDAMRGAFEWDPLRVRHRTLLRQLELPGDFLDRHLSELHGVLEMLRNGKRADGRLRDFVLSFGERMSVRVFAAVLRREGIDATPVDAHDLGLVKRGAHLTLPEDAPEAVARHLAQVRGVPVITGFLALDEEGFLTTLGRDGSDLTAVWFGAALAAEEVQLWKRVRGLMTADPHVVPTAQHLPLIGWSLATEIARHGSGVLHAGAVDPAHRARLTIHVRDLEDPDGPGSRIVGDERKPGVVAIAHRPNVAQLRVRFDAERSRSEQLLELFSSLAAAGVDPYLGSIDSDEAELLLTEDDALERVVADCVPDGVLTRGLSTVTLVGGELDRSPEVDAAIADAAEFGAREFHAGGEQEVRSRVILFERALLEELVRRLHARFFLAAQG